MQHQIGTAAGDVWRCLIENGPMNADKIGKSLKMNHAVVNRAIGWLARENKIRMEKKGNTVLFHAEE